MIYKCSACWRDIGLIGGKARDRDGNPVKFWCPNVGNVGMLVIPLKELAQGE